MGQLIKQQNCFPFRSTPEKAKKKKGEIVTSLPGITIVDMKQQVCPGTHVYVSDGDNRYAGKVLTMDFNTKSAIILFYKWPSDKGGVWKFDESYKWRVEFGEFISILDEPLVKTIGYMRKGYYFRELTEFL